MSQVCPEFRRGEIAVYGVSRPPGRVSRNARVRIPTATACCSQHSASTPSASSSSVSPLPPLWNPQSKCEPTLFYLWCRALMIEN